MKPIAFFLILRVIELGVMLYALNWVFATSSPSPVRTHRLVLAFVLIGINLIALIAQGLIRFGKW